MSTDSDNEFEMGESQGSNKNFAQAGRMKEGSLIMMHENFPCKVSFVKTSKPGKHGSAKAMISAKDIFTGQVYEESFGTKDMTPVPIVENVAYTLMCIDEEDNDALQLMNEKGEIVEHMFLPQESHLKDVSEHIKAISEEGKKECLITVQRFGDRE